MASYELTWINDGLNDATPSAGLARFGLVGEGPLVRPANAAWEATYLVRGDRAAIEGFLDWCEGGRGAPSPERAYIRDEPAADPEPCDCPACSPCVTCWDD